MTGFPLKVSPLNCGLGLAFIVAQMRWLRWGKIVVDKPVRVAFVMLDDDGGRQ